jgi:hypothetical protein
VKGHSEGYRKRLKRDTWKQGEEKLIGLRLRELSKGSRERNKEQGGRDDGLLRRHGEKFLLHEFWAKCSLFAA